MYIKAWFVHFYTALALPLALFSLVAIDQKNIQLAFILNAICVLIDASDGTLARKFEVKKWLPNFDGAKLDDIADFLTYVLVPIYLVLRCEMVPESWSFCLAFPLMASGYGFCQGQAKTDDGFFTGFPSYWNIVVLYLYLLKTTPVLNAVLLVVLSILVFVPIKYLYPSRAKYGKFWLILLGLLWGVMLAYILYFMEATPISYIYLSLLYPAYYTGYSLLLNIRPKR